MENKFKAVRLNANSFPVEPEEISVLSNAGANWISIEGYEVDEILSEAADCDALLVISSKIPADVIRQLERCKVIGRLGTGTDRIAVDVATKQGIVVSNVPDFSTLEMAEHVMALLLAWGRQLFFMTEQMRVGNWEARLHPDVRRISGQTLGLVGLGNSGKALAIRATAFGMKVQAWVRNTKKYQMSADQIGVQLVNLDALLSTSDYVSLHVPLTPNTRGMIGSKQLSLMKRTGVLINASRGAIVDERALVTYLQEQRIGGALLDTFEEIDVFGEHGPRKHPLLELDNVILTPHCGGTSVESTKDQKVRGASYAACVLRGQWPPYVVNSNVKPIIPLSSYSQIH